MSDLPPDERLAKLRTLEAWLDWQLRDTRRKIRAAEEQVEQQRRPRERGRTEGPQRPPTQTGPSTGYKLEPKQRPDHPLPALIHVADCTMANQRTSPVTAADARLALADPVEPRITEGCPFCDPGSQLEKEAAESEG